MDKEKEYWRKVGTNKIYNKNKSDLKKEFAQITRDYLIDYMENLDFGWIFQNLKEEAQEKVTEMAFDEWLNSNYERLQFIN